MESPTTVDNLNVKIIPSTETYEYFCETCMATNTPGLILGVAGKWRAWDEWRGEDGGINWDLLLKLFGMCTVPVVRLDPTEKGTYGGNSQNMSFQEFFEKSFLLDQENSKLPSDSEKYYLKDWHYAIEFKDNLAYEIPSYFRDDYLNAWWEEGREGVSGSASDFKFLYLGAASTFTPLHHDVYKSYSWSVNICGRKRWVLYHPSEEKRLKNKFDSFYLL